jgi:pimeloyl-ACP methyl ester carboxylesterase
MVYWAYRGVYFPLVEATVDQLYWVNQSIMDGMFLCVSCSESIPFIDYTNAAARAEGTFVGTYRLDQQREGCERWERGDIPDDFHGLVDQPIPTLIITGEFDVPVPPYAGRLLADSLPDSFHYTVPNAGHGLNEIWENCLDDMVVRFIDTASPSGLDTSCADSHRRPPFVSWRDYTSKTRSEISAAVKINRNFQRHR